MPLNSKQKGKRGELEACRYLRERGFKNAHRSVQYSGKGAEDSADVVGAMTGIHLEIKRAEKCNPYKYLEQAVRDSELTGNGEVPVVMHRQNRKEWIAIMKFDDFVELYQKAYGNEKGENDDG